MLNVRKGEVYLVDLNDAIGSEQRGVRPAVIVQNDTGNGHSPTTLIVPITSKSKSFNATHVALSERDGLIKPSEAMCEQVRVADKTRLLKCVGRIKDPSVLEEINNKIKIAFGL